MNLLITARKSNLSIILGSVIKYTSSISIRLTYLISLINMKWLIDVIAKYFQRHQDMKIHENLSDR